MANDGWYGVGWGDFGIEFEMTVALLTVLAAMAGVVMHKCAVGLCLGIRRARTG